MPRILLPNPASEKSTYVITMAFTDAVGTPIVPSSVSWTLTDPAGVIINSRSAVPETPAESVSVVLSGEDLAMQAEETGSVKRLFTSEIVYSSTEGSNLPFKAEYAFRLDPLVAVN